MMLEVDARTSMFPRDMWWYLVIFFHDILYVSFVRNWILPQDSPNNTIPCFLSAWWDPWSRHCFDTGDGTQVAITYKDLPQDDRIWCISSHCSVFLAGGKTAPDGTLPRRWLQAWRPHGLLNVWHGPGCAKRSTDFDSRWILVSKLLCLNTTTPPPLIHIGTRQMLHLFWPFCLAYRLASPESEFHPTNPCWKGTVTLEAGRKIRVDTVHSV